MIDHVAVANHAAAFGILLCVYFYNVARFQQALKSLVGRVHPALIGDDSFQRDGILLFQFGDKPGKDEIRAGRKAADEMGVPALDRLQDHLIELFLYIGGLFRRDIAVSGDAAGVFRVHHSSS